MIDLENGRINPEDLPISLFPELTKSLFLDALPGDRLRFSHDSGQGYAWFFLEPATLCDSICSLTVCFDAEGVLYEVRLSVLGEKAKSGTFAGTNRVASSTIPAQVLEDARTAQQLRDKTKPVEIAITNEKPQRPWKPQEENEIKAANDTFLMEQCGFSKKNRNRAGNLEKQYAWGRVTSFYDDKGCSSDIVLRFGTQAQAESGFAPKPGRNRT